MTSTATNTPEIITVDAHADQVACDGGGGALGHPLVYYSFAGKDRITCGYCDREFVRTNARGKAAAGH